MNIKHCTILIRQYREGEDQLPCNACFIYYLTYTISSMLLQVQGFSRLHARARVYVCVYWTTRVAALACACYTRE